MQAGRLDRRISIQAPTEVRDEYGGSTTTWDELREVWAAYIPLRGQELFAAQQVTPEAQVKFRTIWYDGVDERMRIVFEGKNYGIEYVAEIGRRDGLEITAKVLG